MKITKSMKRAIETFVYIAAIATMIFHYSVVNVIFDSLKTIYAMPKWPMYGVPIFLAAGLTLFIAYPIYRKEENESEQ